MEIKKHLKNKVGASMMDYFIISAVSILIGGAIFVMGSQVHKGVKIGTSRIETINETLKNG